MDLGRVVSLAKICILLKENDNLNLERIPLYNEITEEDYNNFYENTRREIEGLSLNERRLIIPFYYFYTVFSCLI